MSNSTASLRRKIDSAGDLRSVVRTMKALAASCIGQYDKSVLALSDYYRTVQLGLGACLRKTRSVVEPKGRAPTSAIVAVVFGSDQGLVGQFNEVVADHAMETIRNLRGKSRVLAVGERVHARLLEAGLPHAQLLSVPSSVKAITPLVGEILVQSESHGPGEANALHLFYNHRTSGAVYSPVSQRLLPLDESWRQALVAIAWPTRSLPEIVSSDTSTLGALIREYLFISLFRSCAESLASENACRLAAMERADKNIDDLVETLNGDFHRMRQMGIDEELFDVVSGFEALSTKGLP